MGFRLLLSVEEIKTQVQFIEVVMAINYTFGGYLEVFRDYIALEYLTLLYRFMNGIGL